MSMLLNPSRFGAVESSTFELIVLPGDANLGTGTLSFDFSAAGAGDRLIILGGTTDGGLFETPSNFTLRHSHAQSVSGFEVGGAIYDKIATGEEATIILAPAGATSVADAICGAAAIVRGISGFDRAGHAVVNPDQVVSPALGALSAQADSLLLCYAVFRDDDNDGAGSFSDDMAIVDEVEFNGGANFSITGILGAEVVGTQANHSRTFSTTAPAEEMIGLLAAWNIG